jgi:hypothetical protein
MFLFHLHGSGNCQSFNPGAGGEFFTEQFFSVVPELNLLFRMFKPFFYLIADFNSFSDNLRGVAPFDQLAKRSLAGGRRIQ